MRRGAACNPPYGGPGGWGFLKALPPMPSAFGMHPLPLTPPHICLSDPRTYLPPPPPGTRPSGSSLAPPSPPRSRCSTTRPLRPRSSRCWPPAMHCTSARWGTCHWERFVTRHPIPAPSPPPEYNFPFLTPPPPYPPPSPAAELPGGAVQRHEEVQGPATGGGGGGQGLWEGGGRERMDIKEVFVGDVTLTCSSEAQLTSWEGGRDCGAGWQYEPSLNPASTALLPNACICTAGPLSTVMLPPPKHPPPLPLGACSVRGPQSLCHALHCQRTLRLPRVHRRPRLCSGQPAGCHTQVRRTDG